MARQKSDLSRAFSEDGARKTHVGGQALIEGIMMRGKYNWSVAVRTPDGSIHLEEHDLTSGRDHNRWMHLPIIRGCVALVESLVLGFKAIEIATMHAFGESEEEVQEEERDVGRGLDALDDEIVLDMAHIPIKEATVPETPDGEGGRQSEKAAFAVAQDAETQSAEAEAKESEGKSDDEGALGHGAIVFSLVLGLALGIALFIIVPAFVTNLIIGEYDEHTIAWNIVDGLLRVAVFVFYLWLIGRMSDIKRMFMYHGAEHKTIHCYEHGLELTPENARSFPRLHVRCGTAFLITVMIIAIFVYTIFPVNAIIDAWGVPDGAPKLALVIVIRILLMPVIAGISYEITVKWAGSHPENPLVKVILWPGMQMQYLTTNEPDDDQIECAINAMQLVLEREEREARGEKIAAEGA